MSLEEGRNLERIAVALERIANSLSEQINSDGVIIANFYQLVRELTLDLKGFNEEPYDT